MTMEDPTLPPLLRPDFEGRLEFLMRQQMHTCWTQEMADAIRTLHKMIDDMTEEAWQCGVERDLLD